MNRFSGFVLLRAVVLLVALFAGIPPKDAFADTTLGVGLQWSETCNTGNVTRYSWTKLGVSTTTLTAAQVQQMCLTPSNFPSSICASGHCSFKASFATAAQGSARQMA